LRHDVVEYLPERPYPNSSEKCDFWFSTSDGIENWMEMKTWPTNFRKPGYAKAITRGINAIIEDIKRLRKKLPEIMIKYILFALYPVYSDSDKYLEKHLDKIGIKPVKQYILLILKSYVLVECFIFMCLLLGSKSTNNDFLNTILI